MKKHYLLILGLLVVISSVFAQSENFVIQNKFISRTIATSGNFETVKIENKRLGKTLIPTTDIEFKLRISKGTHIEGSDKILTSKDFKFIKTTFKDEYKLGFLLKNKAKGIKVEVIYELGKNDFYIKKYLKITSQKSITLERIDVEVLGLDDIYQPYKNKQITAQGVAKWRPGLGQPLYTYNSAMFMGIEFPAAYNYVSQNEGYCGYQWGNTIEKNQVYTSYKSVIGVGNHTGLLQETFFKYIDQIRIRPLRLQVQYNSWFDFGPNVNKESFGKSVAKIHNELVTKRGVTPLKAYVIDDGWQDVNADWSDKTWKINKKFDLNFNTSTSNVQEANSNLGLWMSPGCLFGAEPAAKRYKEQGFETMNNWMSMAGPKYMQLLEERIIDLTKKGVTYFKLDGVFGHLNTREFELNGKKYGIPYMPQLNTEGFSANDKRLNDPKFDELKTYYLVAGTERLMQLFQNQHKVNPAVYVVISNGAYLSPWWLMHIDAVWMINAGDAAGGSNRTEELVYRDGVYYDTWQTEKTQFPLNSVFNHEPKKNKTGESVQAFSEYLWMNLSRGTGFIELYIKTQKLSEKDWDVMAKGLKWAEKVFPYFKYSRMHGGNPKKNEVYGYTAWNEDGGYASFHNPSDKSKTYVLKLDEYIGVQNSDNKYEISSPLETSEKLIGSKVAYGETIEITLSSGEVKVLGFKINNK